MLWITELVTAKNLCTVCLGDFISSIQNIYTKS